MVEEFLRGGQIGDNLKLVHFVEEDNDGDCDCNCLVAFTGSPFNCSLLWLLGDELVVSTASGALVVGG